MENNQNKKSILKWILIPLSLIIAFVGGFFSHYLFRSKSITLATDIIKIMEQVGFVYDETTGEKRPITEEEIANALVNGLFDKHSAYYTQEEYNAVRLSDNGNKTGVGLTLYDTDNVIDKVVFNSPADLAGLQDGDKIIGCVSGERSVTVTNRDDFTNFITATLDNVDVQITVEREIESKVFTVKKCAYISALVEYRDSQKTMVFRTEKSKLVPKVEDGGMALDDTTAYVEFAGFDYGAGEQMEQALEFMKERGRTKLILDLRNNGGGFLTELQEVASLLVYNQGKTKSLIVHAKNANSEQDYYTNSNKFNTEITKICVLANENTASASESLIGAMLYYGDAFSTQSLVIEKNASGVAKTYGKGIKQTTFGLISGGAVKLTTGKVFWPDKTTCIQGKGIYTTEQNSVEGGMVLTRAKAILG